MFSPLTYFRRALLALTLLSSPLVQALEVECARALRLVHLNALLTKSVDVYAKSLGLKLVRTDSEISRRIKTQTHFLIDPRLSTESGNVAEGGNVMALVTFTFYRRTYGRFGNFKTSQVWIDDVKSKRADLHLTTALFKSVLEQHPDIEIVGAELGMANQARFKDAAFKYDDSRDAVRDTAFYRAWRHLGFDNVTEVKIRDWHESPRVNLRR